MRKNRFSQREVAFRWIPTVMQSVLVLACIAIIVLIFSEIWLRYVLHLPLLWVEEIVIIPVFWLYMMGAANGAYERSHIKVDVLDIVIKNPRQRLIFKWIASLATACLAALFIWWGYQMFVWDVKFNPTSATLNYPYVWARCSIFFAGGILCGLYFTIEAVDWGRQLFGGKAPLFEEKKE